jgi:uncharacterized phage protein (TIGR01671 family)
MTNKYLPKFRAWHKELKIMRPVFGMDNIGTDDLLVHLNLSITNEGIISCFLEEIELMQWTGLKTVSGLHELYEGDIVSFEMENANVSHFPNGGKGYIIFKHGCFMISAARKSWKTNAEITVGRGYDAYIGTIQILGNIYSNPELLGGKDERYTI